MTAMDKNVNSDGGRVVITIRIRCEECGEVAAMELTPDAARRTAGVLEAAAAGLEPLEVVVTGRDG